MIQKTTLIIIIVFTLFSCSKEVQKQEEGKIPASKNWQTEVEKTIKLFGHRNWIVVADGAYPKQSNPDIKTENIWKEVSFKNKEISDKSNSEFTNKEIWTEDDASVILPAKNYNLRLPKGSINHKSKFPSGTMRFKREVESERELTNICGAFYELPLQEVGKEPLYKMMRPV